MPAERASEDFVRQDCLVCVIDDGTFANGKGMIVFFVTDHLSVMSTTTITYYNTYDWLSVEKIST